MRRSDLVFFLAGAAALVEETVWARLLARTLGSDAAAAGIVVSLFLLGLGAGALLFARLAQRVRCPRVAYAWIEGLVAAWAASSPFLLSHVEPISSSAARAAFAALVLLPPTLGMGATVPLMARLTVRSRAEATSETSAFYGANTLGAALGALLAPFLFLPLFGLSGALWAAACVGLAAALLGRFWLAEPPAEGDDPTRVPGTAASGDALVPRARFHPLLLAAALLGCASLALEIALLRLLVTVTGASVHAFGIVLFVFLLGIGLGSRQLAGRRWRTGRPESELEANAARARDALFLAAVCAPLFIAAGLFALRLQLGEADLFAGLENRAVQGGSILRAWLAHALFAGLCLLPPALAFGVALPACAGGLAALHPHRERERWIARAYGWNSAGALLGSAGAAFVLLPWGGPRAAVVAALALPFGAALIALRNRPQLQPGEGRGRKAGLALAAIGALAIASQSVFPARARDVLPPLVLAHDAHTTASVHEARTSGGETLRALRVNGKAEASTALVDLRLQYLLGHVPGLLHGNVERALVIGLGTGMTSGALLDLPSVRSVEVVEISSAVARVARSFDEWNGALLADARVTLTIADGRHRLATADERWDLITSDPVHPWTRGSSDLYTLEHFEAMAAHLAPKGVASQWLPLYELSLADVRTVVATWCAAFPHASAWLTAYDLVLVGALDAPRGTGALAALQLPPRVRARLAPLGIHRGTDVAALQVADRARLLAFAAGETPMVDDRPVLEFRAPRSALAGYCVEALAWAIEPEVETLLASTALPAARAQRAALERFLAALPRGFTPAAERLGEELAGRAR